MPARLTARRRKEIASLTRKKHRDHLGQFLIEGVRAVEAAVAAGAPLVELLVSETVQAEARVQVLLAEVAVPVYVVPERDLARLSDVQTSQGLLAVACPRLLPEAHLETLDTVLALDGVQDPGNAGAVIRTAAWFGVEAVLAGPGTADLFQPKVVRATMGGLWDVHLAQTADLPAQLAHLRRHGFACYGADLHGTPVQAWRPRRPSVLVLGSEAHGLASGVQTLLAERVCIAGATQRTATESLNVAVAAGILIYAWMGGLKRET